MDDNTVRVLLTSKVKNKEIWRVAIGRARDRSAVVRVCIGDEVFTKKRFEFVRIGNVILPSGR